MTLTTYCEPIRSRPVNAIDTEAVLRVLYPIWTTIPETASRLRGRIENILDAARARGFHTGENPAQWCGHLKTLLPARQRLTRGNAQIGGGAGLWSEFDLDKAIWTIPALRMKWLPLYFPRLGIGTDFILA